MEKQGNALYWWVNDRLAVYQDLLAQLEFAISKWDEDPKFTCDILDSMCGYLRATGRDQIAPHFERLATDASCGRRPDICSMPSMDEIRSKLEDEARALTLEATAG